MNSTHADSLSSHSAVPSSLQALGENPRQACDALYAAGHHFLRAERYADAASFFRMMLVVGPQDERGWLALGHCHELTGHPELAFEVYGSGAQIAERRTRCLLACSRICERAGDTDRVDAILEAAELEASKTGEEELVTAEKSRRLS
jgi:uncharacterized protein HemY